MPNKIFPNFTNVEKQKEKYRKKLDKFRQEIEERKIMNQREQYNLEQRKKLQEFRRETNILKAILRWGNTKWDERHIIYAITFGFISALLGEYGPVELNLFSVQYTLDLGKIPIILGGAYFGPLIAGTTGIFAIVVAVIFREGTVGEMFHFEDVISATTGEQLRYAYTAGAFVAVNYFLYGFITGIIVGIVHVVGPSVRTMTRLASGFLFTIVLVGTIVLIIHPNDATTTDYILYPVFGGAVLVLLITLLHLTSHLEIGRSIRTLDEIVISEVILAVVVTFIFKSTWLILTDYKGKATKGAYDYIFANQAMSLPIDALITTLFVFIFHIVLGKLNLDE